MAEGAWSALAIGLAILALFLVERWAPRRWRPAWYFALAVPLGAALVPIAHPPEGAGRTASVAWEVVGDTVRFWVDGRGSAPVGLHGRVRLVWRVDGSIDLDVGFAPPWAAVLGVGWIALLGALRGDGPAAGVIAALLGLALFLVYRQAALSAAAQLRWAFVQGRSERP